MYIHMYFHILGNTFPYYTIGLAGLFIGLGEIIGETSYDTYVHVYIHQQWHNALYVYVGGGTFGILGHYTNRWGRDPVVLLGLVSHFITFLLVFYNLPNAAIHGKVADPHGQLFNSSK